jgi:phage baseplate assembly protein W
VSPTKQLAKKAGSPRRYIGALSESERAAMAPHAERWIEYSLGVGRADRARVERGILTSYRFAGLKPPKQIVWVESPAVLSVVGPIAAYIIALREAGLVDVSSKKKRTAVGTAVGTAVHTAVDTAVHTAVDTAVGTAVDTAVHTAVGTAVHTAVDTAVGTAVGTAVDTAVDTAVGTAVHTAVDTAVDTAVRTAVRTAVDTAVRTAVDTAVHTAVDTAVHTAVDTAVDDFRSLPQSEIARGAFDAIARGWGYRLGGRWWPGWYWGPAYVSFLRDVVGLQLDGDILGRSRAYEDLMSAGWLWLHRDFAIVCDLPLELHREELRGDAMRRLHRTDGPALRWADGTALWYLRGVSVPQHVVEDPAAITAAEIQAQANAEVRRVMIDQFGAAKYLTAIGAREIHRDEKGVLLHADIGDVEPLVMVRVVNSTPEPIAYKPGVDEAGEMRGSRWFRHYTLRVPPTMKTAHEAVAWAGYSTVSLWRPAIET